MALIQDLITSDRYGIKSPFTMNPVGICVHNTANDASAKNEIAYMKRNNNEVSFHVAVDDVEAIQAIPFNRNAWASGDGGSGKGNRTYIHMEICYSKSGGERFDKAEARAAKEIADLCKRYGWGISNIKKHQDFSNKYCPHRTLDKGWDRFLNMVQKELNGANTSQSAPTPAPQKPVQNTGEYIQKEYRESGKFTCTEDKIYFRNKPIIQSSNPIQGNYTRNESVYYDYVVITNKYVYISWIGATGARRYMPITDKVANEKWGYCV